MKKTVIGILAHVDAGKTTLSESMLYLSGSIQKLGRVDHQDAFLDYDTQERNRGITIFSKKALFHYNDVEFTLLDTPGHIDFSTEMERVLQVLDYAIIVINGSDGLQSHSETIWKLLKHYHIPAFIFVNKMDISHHSKEDLLKEIQERFDERCYDFTNLTAESYEQMALINEDVLSMYLEKQNIDDKTLANLIYQRELFPCFFGSALKMEGIQEFLDKLTHYIIEKEYPKEFGARVFKITYENQQRLTHMKITGGTLKVKEVLEDEKVDQIRLYSGTKYQMVDEVQAGSICVIKGLKNIEAGQGLGFEDQGALPVLSSCMEYKMILPVGMDSYVMMQHLRQLQDEDPQLHIHYIESLDEIRVQLMGEVQIDILKQQILDRFNVEVDFGQGNILYKETIQGKVEGIGHYEPLRHYAEVHLLLEEGPRGSGLVFKNKCREGMLSRQYQRLILSHLEEKEHLGVLTGSPITDMKITLVAGKAHVKHTEGGDFRQATYRAVRQGLKRAQNVLLEPYYSFKLRLPNESLSRAIYDIDQMNGVYTIEQEGDQTLIQGKAPVQKMQNYGVEVMSYTRGKGNLQYYFEGYEPCSNQEEIIAQISYDSEADLENPTGSVFCAHGAGFNVSYDEVDQYMHIDYVYQEKPKVVPIQGTSYHYQNQDEELEKIFERTYGPTKRRAFNKTEKETKTNFESTVSLKPECLLVDGYNVIYAWTELKEIAKDNLDAARMRLIDIMSNYQGFKKCELIVVFDAYKVKGNIGTTQKYHNIYVTYTKEAQTADMYIERATHELSDHYQIVVATSDALEQLIVLGQGGRRISSRELLLEVEHLTSEKMSEFERNNPKHHAFQLEEIKNYQSE